MDSLYILIPIAIIFVGIAVKIFLWAVDSDQFDDLDVEGQRILFDDDVGTKKQPDTSNKSENQSAATAPKEQQKSRE